MKRTLILLFIIFPLLNFSQSEAAQTITVTGKVIDINSKNAVEFATIVFRNVESGEIDFGGITDQNGNFSIKANTGSYNVSIEYLSYKTKSFELTNIRKDVDLGVILLEVDTEFLDEVQITVERKMVALKPKKNVINVSKDLSSTGNMAIDILSNIPAVEVDMNGNISLRGQPNTTVMINGKISALSKSEALKSLPAGAIERIEVISNPGATFKASSIGIINIVLKKGEDLGYNGAITTTAGYKDYYGILMNISHGSSKMNFYTNTSFFHRNPIQEATYKNNYFGNNLSYSNLNEQSSFSNKSDGLLTNIGFDFYLTERSSLSTTINYQKIASDNKASTFSQFLSNSFQELDSNERFFRQDFENELFEFTASYEQRFKKEGKKFELSLTQTNDTDSFDNEVDNLNPAFENEQYKIKNELINSIVDAKLSVPLGEKTTYAIGYNGEFGKIPFRNDKISESKIDYMEDVHAAFAEFEYTGDNWYFGIGIRGEFANSEIDYLSNNGAITKDYNDLFPSFYTEYTMNEKSSLSLSYSKNILRPDYYTLLPFEEEISEINSYKGNENIDPIYIDVSSFTYSHYNDKFTFQASLFYNKYTDYIQRVTYETGELVNGVPKILTTPVNLGHVNYSGLDLTTIWQVNKKLSLTASALFVNFEQEGVFTTTNDANEMITRDYEQNSSDGNFRLLAQFKLPKFVNFQSQIKHYLTSTGPFSERAAYTFANLAIQKDIFNGNGSLSLNVDDVFKSNTTKRDRFDDAHFSESEIKAKYRKIIFSFTYRFNQSKKSREIDFSKKENKPNY